MAHTRIRTFNTRDTYPEQRLDNDLCQAVVTRGGRTVYLRGQCPQDLDTARSIESHDAAEQTHQHDEEPVHHPEQRGRRSGPEATHQPGCEHRPGGADQPRGVQ